MSYQPDLDSDNHMMKYGVRTGHRCTIYTIQGWSSKGVKSYIDDAKLKKTFRLELKLDSTLEIAPLSL